MLLQIRVFLVIILVTVFFGTVNSSKSALYNLTGNFYSLTEGDEIFHSLRRLPRFLTFNALEDDLKVDLEFAVPFIKIPTKRTKDAATAMAKSLANVNLTAILLTGLIAILGITVGSAFTSITNNINWNGFDNLNFSYKNSRGMKEVKTIQDIVNSIDDVFQTQDIDITSCFQKSICFWIKASSKKVIRGNGSSLNKIIDGITSSKWILGTIQGSAISDAIAVGRSSASCDYKYYQCKWNEATISDIFVRFLHLV